MVSHIYLQNFQSIKGPVQINFAPITLLYGPNSAGKSAVFDAIRIAGELCNEDPDWNVEAQMEAQLPSFMHMHDFAQTMVIGVGATISFAWIYPPSALGSFQLSDFFPSLAEFVEGSTDDDAICRWDVRFVIAFGFSKWEDQANSVKPYVDIKAVEISESGKKLVRLDLERGSIEIDLSHRLVRTINRYLALDGKSLQGLCADVIAESNLLVSESVLSISGGEFDLDMARIPPDHLWQSFNHPYSPEKIASRSRHELEILLQYLIFSPIRGVGAAARMVNRIGPLRLIPKPEQLQFFLSVRKHGGMERWSAAPVSGRVGVWEDGSVAWTKLAANCEVAVVKKDRANGETSFTNRLLVDAVNDWLSEPERLGLDSSIGITTREVVCGSSLLEQERTSWAGARTSAETMERIAVIRMKNTRLGVLAAVDDVGAGIAQIVPILVAGFDSCQTAVEQPELHLHPKLQVQVADFFLSAWNLRLNRSIIETHSEYLALRLLRRIRETSKADIRHREFSLDIGDIAFYYFNPIGGETKVTNLRASPEGEFLDRWPKGFFGEREAELFDEDD